MRLQLLGNYTLDEFQVAVSKIIDNFKSNDIESFRNINIYLRTCKDGKEVKLIDNEQEVDHLICDFEQRRQIQVLSREFSVVTTHKVTKKKPVDD